MATSPERTVRPRSQFDLVAVGDVMVDVVAPPLTDPSRHAEIEIRAAGSAVNASRAARLRGKKAVVVGCVGDDRLAGWIRDELAAEEIETRLSSVDARTGRAVYAGDAVVAERGANARFAPEHVPDDVVGTAVLVSGYQLFRADSGAGAQAAFALGGLIGVDLGGAGVVQAFGSERARETVATADVVLGDAAAMDALGSVSGPLLVTTLGRDGARCGNVHVRPPRVLDRRLIGSGDAFAAAVLVALAGSASVEEALTQGCEAGTGSWLSRADGSRIQQ